MESVNIKFGTPIQTIIHIKISQRNEIINNKVKH